MTCPSLGIALDARECGVHSPPTGPFCTAERHRPKQRMAESRLARVELQDAHALSPFERLHGGFQARQRFTQRRELRSVGPGGDQDRRLHLVLEAVNETRKYPLDPLAG